MKRIYKYVEYSIDVFAVLIVLETFLRFLGITLIKQETMIRVDYVLIVLLLLDLIYRYRQSDIKKSFFKEHWLEFVSLIPFLPGLRLFRIFRIAKKSRLKGFLRTSHQLLKNNGLYYVIIVVMLLTLLGGGMLYRVEEGHIKSVGDAIWLAFVTMTTVGYGDYYPVTEGGRFISVILMVLGIGFLGLLTGSVASFFTKRKSSHSNMKSSIDISDLNDAEKGQLLSYLEFIRSKKS